MTLGNVLPGSYCHPLSIFTFLIVSFLPVCVSTLVHAGQERHAEAPMHLLLISCAAVNQTPVLVRTGSLGTLFFKHAPLPMSAQWSRFAQSCLFPVASPCLSHGRWQPW